jgi:hypothetical protein
MEQLATSARPLRIAIIGAGPAGFYAAETLLKKRDIVLTIDIFNRFPTPFGLVRDGVAPDHQSIKAVIRVFDKVLADPRVRFFGNVTNGILWYLLNTLYKPFYAFLKEVSQNYKLLNSSQTLAGTDPGWIARRKQVRGYRDTRRDYESDHKRNGDGHV